MYYLFLSVYIRSPILLNYSMQCEWMTILHESVIYLRINATKKALFTVFYFPSNTMNVMWYPSCRYCVDQPYSLLSSLANHHIARVRSSGLSGRSDTLLGKLSRVPGLDPRDANTVIMDFFSAGVTTVSN